MTTTSQKRLKALQAAIKKQAITYADESQKIVSPSGQAQKWLLDLRPVLLDTKALNRITSEFWDRYEDKLPFQIAGMEVAAVPLLVALLIKADQRKLSTSGFLIRKERKTTGLGKRIEGVITNDPVILVDDIVNSGDSLEKARTAIEQEGKKIDTVFTIVNFENAKAQRWAEKHGVKIDHLYTPADFDLEVTKSTAQKSTRDYDIKWRFFEPGAFPFHVAPKSTPLIIQDRIVMGAENGNMICIDRETGQEIWRFDTKTHHNKGIWSSPAHHDGCIYFGAYNGIAYCLNAQTGQEIWRNPCCEFIGSSPLIVEKHGLMYLGLEHQRPRQQGSNAAFNLKNSQRVWERAQAKYQHGSAAYYEPKDLVIFGNADHDITAYEALTGKTIWSFKTGRSIKYAPAIDEKTKLLAAASFDGNIYILDAETGAHKASIQTNDICYTTPLITHGKIFAGSGDRHMYIIDANTFELIKKMDCGARVYSSPQLIDGSVIFGTNGGLIIELNPDTLEIEGKAQLPDAITNAISASDDGSVLYASTCMNELYAINRRKI